MIEVRDLVRIADAYRVAVAAGADGVLPEDNTVSYRVFRDTKRLSQLREGREITVGRLNNALRWFDANWPSNSERPPELVHYLQPTSFRQETAA